MIYKWRNIEKLGRIQVEFNPVEIPGRQQERFHFPECVGHFGYTTDGGMVFVQAIIKRNRIKIVTKYVEVR